MDQHAFQSSVFVHKDKMFRLAKRLLVSSDEAFDAVQDVMVKLWQMRADLHHYRNIEAFVMQCIKNECFNRLKHEEVAMAHRQSVISGVRAESFPAADNMKEIILELINALPPKQQMAIHLKDIEEYTIPEIAVIMGMEENAVRINLMRARQRIKDQLEKLFEYEQRQN